MLEFLQRVVHANSSKDKVGCSSGSGEDDDVSGCFSRFPVGLGQFYPDPVDLDIGHFRAGQVCHILNEVGAPGQCDT